ncbi:membrane protein [Pseudomonas aeruginosa]|nr:membrane protein [Pseudomonas aeruginosa]
MTFMTNDYLEYYLTLLGWIINNGIWNMISDTGLFAVPFAAIVLREWLKVRGEGADEGNKGVLSLARIETHIYVGYIVVALAGIPVVNVSFDTIEFDQARAQQCQYSLPAPADTGWSNSFSSLAGKSAQMPLWWAMMHALSKGFTAGAVAAIPCGTDLRQMRMEVDNTRVNNPLLAQQIADFSRDCYGPSRARLFMRQPDLGSVAEDNKALQDLNWIGSRFLLNTPGYYDTDYSKSPRQSWPYNATRDAGLPQVGGGGGYPTCKQWWADSGIGLRDRIKDQVDPDLMTSFLKWAKWLNQEEVTEAVIRQVISPSSQVKGNVYTDYGGQVGGTGLERHRENRRNLRRCPGQPGLFPGDGYGPPSTADGDVVPQDGHGHLHSDGPGHRHLSTESCHDDDGRLLCDDVRRFLVSVSQIYR